MRLGLGLSLALVAGVAPPPVLTSIAPNAAPEGGGTSVTLTGSGFMGATSATTGGVALGSFVVVNDTTITGVVGAGTKGVAQNVVVTRGSLTATLTGGWNYIPASLAWCDASFATSVTVASNKATAIADRSGNAHTFVEYSAGFGLGYGSTTINGLNTLHGTGSTSMKCTGISGQADFTIIAVAKVLVSAGYNGLFGFGSFDPAMYVHGTHPDPYWSGDNDFSDTVAVNDVKTFVWHSAKAASRTFSLFLNGAASAQNPKTITGGSGANTSAGLGLISESAAGPGDSGGFDVGEFLVFSSVLSTGDRQIVESYLRTKWAHY